MEPHQIGNYLNNIEHLLIESPRNRNDDHAERVAEALVISCEMLTLLSQEDYWRRGIPSFLNDEAEGEKFVIPRVVRFLRDPELIEDFLRTEENLLLQAEVSDSMIQFLMNSLRGNIRRKDPIDVAKHIYTVKLEIELLKDIVCAQAEEWGERERNRRSLKEVAQILVNGIGGGGIIALNGVATGAGMLDPEAGLVSISLGANDVWQSVKDLLR